MFSWSALPLFAKQEEGVARCDVEFRTLFHLFPIILYSLFACLLKLREFAFSYEDATCVDAVCLTGSDMRLFLQLVEIMSFSRSENKKSKTSPGRTVTINQAPIVL